MTLSLTPEEAEELQDVLESYLSDLRMEIADTESMTYRENLKARSRFLQKLVEHLGAERPAG